MHSLISRRWNEATDARIEARRKELEVFLVLANEIDSIEKKNKSPAFELRCVVVDLVGFKRAEECGYGVSKEVYEAFTGLKNNQSPGIDV
jgi:hypothetical protein